MSTSVLGESSCGPRSRRFDQMTRASLARVRRPPVSSNTPGQLDSCPRDRKVDHRSWAIGPRSDGLRSRPAVPEDLHPAPIDRGFDKLYRATWARVRWHAGSTRFPGGLAQCSDGLQDQPAVPGHLGQCPRTRDVDQLSRVTRTQVRGPTVLTSCPGRLGLWSEEPRGQPALPGLSARVLGPTVSTS